VEQISNWPFVQNKLVVVHNGVRPVVFYTKEDAREKLSSFAAPSSSLYTPPSYLRRQGSPTETHETLNLVEGDREDTIQEDTLGAPIIIGTFAELHPVKGLDVLIDAAKEIVATHPHVYFYIFGEGDERKNLENQIKRRCLESHFILLGYVESAPRYLKALDIFVLPSRSEALSLAVLEAGLAALPTVATAVGGIQEIITDKENGLLAEKENPKALVTSLNTLIENKDTRDTYAAALHETITENFSFEKTLRETENLY
jgi:glycosyltransferase involved in cell wall biosynthesis